MQSAVLEILESQKISFSSDLILLNEKQYCEITKQTLSTIRANRIKGTGCNFYKIGGSVRYKLCDILEYLEKCKRQFTTLL